MKQGDQDLYSGSVVADDSVLLIYNLYGTSSSKIYIFGDGVD